MTLVELLILIPLITALLIPLLKEQAKLRELVSLVSGLALAACSFALINDDWQQHNIILATPWQGWEIKLTPEPLGLLFSLLVSCLWPVTTLYAIGYLRRLDSPKQGQFYLFFALSIAMTQGIALSGNLLTLFLFYELLTLATYPLVTHSGSEGAKKAGRLYLSILMGSSLLLLLLAIAISFHLSATLNFQNGGIFPENSDLSLLNLLLLLFVLGTAKAALMPLHSWLPAAMVAPVPVSALLHAVAVVKAGVFTIIKVSIYIFGFDLMNQLSAADFLAYLAGFTMVAASIIALKKDNLKARLAYSTIGQLSYIVMAAMLANSSATMGAGLQIVSHAFAKISLFFCAGLIMLSTGKTAISQLNGIGSQIPKTLIFFTLASLSIIGLPPLAGVWSKWWLVTGVLESSNLLLLLCLLLSTLLNIIYLLEIPVRAFLFQAKTENVKTEPKSALLATAITVSGCFILFFAPQPLYQLISQVSL